MPANLTPQYLEAELRFKQAKTTEAKIKALEVMMAVVPKHKETEKIRAQLKTRMAKGSILEGGTLLKFPDGMRKG